MVDVGYDTIGSSQDNPANNVVWDGPYTCPSAGTITAALVRASQRLGPAPTLATCLYNDNSGVPGTKLVASTDSPVAVGASQAWLSQSYSQAMSNGQKFWIAWLAPAYTGGGSPTNDYFVQVDANAGHTSYFIASVAEAFPASGAGASAISNEQWSAYVTLSTGTSGSGAIILPRPKVAGVGTPIVTGSGVIILSRPKVAGNGGAGNLPVDYYHTSFPLTESPMSEGGIWLQGLRDGLDWANVNTTPALAVGSQSGNGTGSAQFNDSTALVQGTWQNNQKFRLVIVNNQGAGGDWSAEVEGRLRSNITAHSNTGYEFEVNCQPADSTGYADIVRWNGALGDFTGLIHVTGIYCVTGDVIEGTAIGNVLTLYRNGAQIAQVTDSTYSSGLPGVGMYLHNRTGTGDPTKFGASDFISESILPASGAIVLARPKIAGAMSATIAGSGAIVLPRLKVAGASQPPPFQNVPILRHSGDGGGVSAKDFYGNLGNYRRWLESLHE